MTINKVIPSDDRVLVLVEKAKEKNIGGVLLPTTQLHEYMGKIVALGNDVIYNDRQMKPLSQCYNIGDKIIFEKGSGLSISLNGEEHCILRRLDILATIIEGDNQ